MLQTISVTIKCTTFLGNLNSDQLQPTSPKTSSFSKTLDFNFKKFVLTNLSLETSTSKKRPFYEWKRPRIESLWAAVRTESKFKFEFRSGIEIFEQFST